MTRRVKSIRRYLLVSLILALVAGSLIVVALTYVHAAGEINELYDRNMMEVAATLETQIDALKLGKHHVAGARGPGLGVRSKKEQDYLLQIWDAKRRTIYASHNGIAFPYQETPGLRMVEVDGRAWRTYGVVKDDVTIQITQLQKSRDHFVREMAFALLYPLLGWTPIVGVLIWLAVGRSLRPLNTISDAITKRSATSLEPIDETTIPLEIKPMVQELNALLVRLNTSLEAQRRFTADAAHELRTPLTALQLQLSNLRRVTSDTGRQEHADKLQHGIDRAANVVRQMLALARVEPNAAESTLKPVELSQLAREVLMLHAQEAVAKTIDLGTQRMESVWVRGSVENLRVLIENLVGNALRYTPVGGKVSVSVYGDGDSAKLEVLDTGIGIAPADRGRVFERFYRVLGSNTEGSGLGLSIARNVVGQHRGTIRIEDGAGGVGTCFVVTLPLDGTNA